ncbi:MAG TPA: L-seryl-tRNA(Sec) selenium transferase, partial [Oscillatoriaceae cyanobacterium]
RLPEVIAASGARLVEVGTTNKTYSRDYARAVGPETGLLMLSHTSNYRIIGFTAEVAREELAALGRENGIPTMEDLGSGLLVDLAPFGIPPEPTVQASIAAGLDLVAVSGDKLMGGSQCGILVGRSAIVDRLKQNPLLRALRQDKLAIAALEATLKLYLQPERLTETLPLFAMLAKTPAVLQREAEALAKRLSGIQGLTIAIVPGRSSVGGGTLPGVELDTCLVALRSALSADELARRLRTGEPAVVARIADDALLLDPRTLLDGDVERLARALEKAL